jgi:hypothetical protein
MKDAESDRLVMLLSTDWFFEHWAVAGLTVDRQKRECVRDGSREIVETLSAGHQSITCEVGPEFG